MKFPATLGECADELYTKRKKRLKFEASAEEIKKEETELKLHIIKLLRDSKQKGARGMVATVALSPKTIPTVDVERGGWEALQDYIKDNDAFDLLHRRVNEKAYLARLAEGVVVPGLKPENVMNLSVNKAGRSKAYAEGSKGSSRGGKQGEGRRAKAGQEVQQRRDGAAERPHPKRAQQRGRTRRV